MNEEEILESYQVNADSNWGRLIVLSKKYFDNWAMQTIRPHWKQLKLSYMPLISNIRLKGSTSNEISKRSLIAKQSLSVTIKELEEQGMVTSSAAKKDKRSYKINLTPQGKKFMLVANEEITSLTDQYKSIVGEADFNTAVRVLQAINQYHENLNSVADEEE